MHTTKILQPNPQTNTTPKQNAPNPMLSQLEVIAAMFGSGMCLVMIDFDQDCVEISRGLWAGGFNIGA